MTYTHRAILLCALAAQPYIHALKMLPPEEICKQQGLQPGTPAYTACVTQEQARQSALIQKIMVEEQAPDANLKDEAQTFAEIDGCMATVEIDELGNTAEQLVPAGTCNPSTHQIMRM